MNISLRLLCLLCLINLTACSGGGGSGSNSDPITIPDSTGTETTSGSDQDNTSADATDENNDAAAEEEDSTNAEEGDDTGASGTDSSSGTDTSDSQSTDSTADADSLEIKTFESGALSAGDAGNVAKTVISALSRRIANRPLAGQTLEYESAPTLSTNTEISTSDCALAGTSTAYAHALSQWADMDDASIRVYTKDDVLKADYDQCQVLLGTDHEEIFDGHSETRFLSGFASNHGGIYSDKASFKLVYDRMTYLFEPLKEPNYRHGSVTKSYESNSHDLSGHFYAQRVAVIDETTDTLVEQIITTQANFLWTVAEGPSPSLTGSGRVGSDLLNFSFQLEITAPLKTGVTTNTGWAYEIINEGRISAISDKGEHLRVTFFQEYIDYEFDSDDDGDFEQSGTRFWNQILPTTN